MAVKKKAPSGPEMTTYALKLKHGGERRVTVPTAYKITFGPTVPYERNSNGSRGDGTWALRFYSGDKLKAIFTDVSSFRDTSIQILEKRTRTKRQVVGKSAKMGSRSTVLEATVESWVDPDNPEDESAALDEAFLIGHQGEDVTVDDLVDP